MKKSLRLKLTVFLTISIVLTILLCLFANRFFLEPFYVSSKHALLADVYNEIEESISEITDYELSEEQQQMIDRIEVANNVKVYLFFSYEQEIDIFKIYGTKFVYPQSVRVDGSGIADREAEKREFTRILTSVKAYTFQNSGDHELNEVKLLENEGAYSVYTQYNIPLDSKFMDLYGTIQDNQYAILIRSGLESVQEAVAISNRFLLFAGLIVLAIGGVIAYLFGRRFTKPVLELSDIAKSISELHFDIKYPVTTKDEIGQLGHSINILSETLEQTISELKSANIELQTDIAKKLEIDEMRKEFLSNVTHELKTPIALIQGYAEGLKENINEDAESRDFYCEVIIDESMKMNKMVKKLLSLNQIEFGNTQVEIERFDLTQLITSVINTSELLFRQKEIKPWFEETGPIFVWADEYLIEEVLTNYISNALNHVAQGSIVRVNTERVDSLVRVTVFNQGEQIPAEDIDRIWDKFYKVDKARTREYGGNGIGLSIVKAIMESHQQKYGVQNETDGVSFWFELDASDQ